MAISHITHFVTVLMLIAKLVKAQMMKAMSPMCFNERSVRSMHWDGRIPKKFGFILPCHVFCVFIRESWRQHVHRAVSGLVFYSWFVSMYDIHPPKVPLNERFCYAGNAWTRTGTETAWLPCGVFCVFIRESWRQHVHRAVSGLVFYSWFVSMYDIHPPKVPLNERFRYAGNAWTRTSTETAWLPCDVFCVFIRESWSQHIHRAVSGLVFCSWFVSCKIMKARALSIRPLGPPRNFFTFEHCSILSCAARHVSTLWLQLCKWQLKIVLCLSPMSSQWLIFYLNVWFVSVCHMHQAGNAEQELALKLQEVSSNKYSVTFCIQLSTEL